MKLIISRNPNDWRNVGKAVCLEARTIAEDSVTVEISRDAWNRILVRWPLDPVAKLEEMSCDSRAHWARFATKRVWRLYL